MTRRDRGTVFGNVALGTAARRAVEARIIAQCFPNAIVDVDGVPVVDGNGDLTYS
jgi:hypothetical protein